MNNQCKAGKGARAICTEIATHTVKFKDEDTIPACESCALGLQEIAKSHGYPNSIKVTRIL
jgi:hypothetical protein